MAGLIVSILSIVFAVLIIAAGFYFGGSATHDGQTAADAARLVNEGAQISGAAEMYYAQEGVYATSMSQLVASKYLRSSPQANWAPYKDTAVLTGVDHARCLALNAKAGVEGIPLCTAAGVSGQTLCCEQSLSLIHI